MFHFCISRGDIATGRAWTWTGGRWHCGSSWIEPYRHTLTEQIALTDGIRTVFVSAARKTGAPSGRPEPTPVSPGDYDRALRRLREDRDDWTAIEVTDAHTVVSTGTACTAPQYLATSTDALHGSWDLLDLRDHQHPDRVDHIAITRHLALRNRYSASTFWQDIRLLTERATARFGPEGPLVIQFPEPAEHSRARSLQDGNDPVPLFQDLLDLSVSRAPWRGSRTAVQLSGGMDSTVVSLALRTAPQGAGVTAGTVVLDHERGTQQNERRRLILDYIASGWSGLTVHALDHLPYGPSSRFSRTGWISPTTDIYGDALDTLSDRFADRGIDAVFSGIGGDELMAVTAAEDREGRHGFEPEIPPWLGPVARGALKDVNTVITPAAVVPETALMAKTVCGPAFLRRGLWPIHPLTDPVLVRFCEWLPVEWRDRKRLMREIIGRTGMPHQVARPPLAENFQQVITLAMRRNGAPRLRKILAEGSPLIEAGLLDPVGLAHVASRLEGDKATAGDHEVVFALLVDSALTCR
ncbi:asparagine synthase-related protein [Kitasatospora griseola]|uniref:asparagine synthase-related protein n=1 Tax=Kitasatospora griseola TaxID=2064 RepID=UPI00341F4122